METERSLNPQYTHMAEPLHGYTFSQPYFGQFVFLIPLFRTKYIMSGRSDHQLYQLS